MGQHTLYAVLAQTDGSGDAGGVTSSIILFAIIGFVFYFFVIRPQRRRVADMRSLHSSLETGDEVRTVGGMFGRIESIDESQVVLDMGEGTRLRFTVQAIAAKVQEPDA